MPKAIDCLLHLIEKPFTEKLYRDLKKSYLETFMKEEAEALEYLIQQRFKENGTNSLPIDTEQ